MERNEIIKTLVRAFDYLQMLGENELTDLWLARSKEIGEKLKTVVPTP